MADISETKQSEVTRITGGNENFIADVTQDPVDSVYRLQTSAKNDPQGLRGEWKITTIQVTDVATLLPATALADRNFIRIENTEPSKDVYIGPNNSITADKVVGTTSGKLLESGESVTFDFKDNLNVYGICTSGQTALVQVIEAK